MAALNAESYLAEALKIAQSAAGSQLDNLRAAAELACAALKDGHQIFGLGTGHSHMIVEELYGRAGGMMAFQPILEPSLMLHEGLEKSSRLERLPGLGKQLIRLHGVSKGDCLIIASNSGRNAVPVEAAEEAQRLGARVVAFMSIKHAGSVTSRAPSGRMLSELADVVIDNCGIPGDAVVPNEPHPVGPTSTMVSCLLAQALVVEIIGRMRRSGMPLDVFLSLNVD